MRRCFHHHNPQHPIPRTLVYRKWNEQATLRRLERILNLGHQIIWKSVQLTMQVRVHVFQPLTLLPTYDTAKTAQQLMASSSEGSLPSRNFEPQHWLGKCAWPYDRYGHALSWIPIELDSFLTARRVWLYLTFWHHCMVYVISQKQQWYCSIWRTMHRWRIQW